MTRRYFGTDGVRGRVGEMPITPDWVMRLGYAAGRTLASHAEPGNRPTVLIGKDTRLSGYMLESALEAGFSAAGVDVLLAGPVPTPAVAYLTRALRLSAGVVISASHNPFADNGIKFFAAGGLKLPDSEELLIESALEAGLGAPVPCVAPEALGRARRVVDARGRYIEFCKSCFPNDLDLKGLRIVVDCAHGAAYDVAPQVLHELGAEVVQIGCEPDGLNINQQVGATAPAALQAAVRRENADIGIALDGDGDRLIMVDATGRLYDGDDLLYLIINERLSRGPVAGVVGTLMTNLALEHALAARKVPFARAKVGDRYVLEMLQAKGWLYGGENSGHLLCLDCHSTGDGIISALQVLAAIRRSGKPLQSLIDGFERYPQVMINVPVPRGQAWQDNPAIQAAVAAAESELEGRGRLLLRPSGTEPLLRVMVESADAEAARSLAARVAEEVRRQVDTTAA